MALKIEAFAEDCARAAVVVSAREAQRPCAATLVDRRTWRAHGAVALRWSGSRFEETFARPPGTDRPWARAPATTAETAQPASAARDATPRAEKIWRRGIEMRVPGAAQRVSGALQTRDRYRTSCLERPRISAASLRAAARPGHEGLSTS
jgi:hypothetical protein